MSTRAHRRVSWVGGKEDPNKRTSELPLRAEVFSAEQLQRHAKALAAGHRTGTREMANPLLDRLAGNEESLREFNRKTLAVQPGRHITPAAEWLLDNFYLIEEQIQMARRHLPRAYSRELPCLVNHPAAGFPRVYDIVIELITHTDAEIDVESLSVFVGAYQTVESLKLGELWAIPIMLRLGLIENLKRVTNRLVVAREDRDHADLWVSRLHAMAETDPSRLVVVVADMAKSNPPASSAFVAEFTERLSRQSPSLHIARGWLEQYLIGQGFSIEELVHQESQNQAADQISVSHSISSLRFLSAMDWKEFVESLSLVEEILRSDPSGIYRKMDFATRDTYRHGVETIARHGNFSEAGVARQAVELAAECARKQGAGDRASHVGFHLIGKGRPALGRLAGTRWPIGLRMEQTIQRFPLLFYAGGIGFLTLLSTIAVIPLVSSPPMNAATIVFLVAAFAICSSQLAVSVMNWFSAMVLKPRGLPRLDFSRGILAEQRTLIVIPTMLTGREEVASLLEDLELHHLSNTDPHLHFALLTDLPDAAEEILPGDAALIEEARAGVDMLNTKYAPGARSLFFLFHRPRHWNPGEGLWMGYERKRGKLAELNAVLLGGPEDRFSMIAGETSILTSVKYVITLDTDTQLPRDVARRLVATMAHPLNRPVFDPQREIVVEGYGILQPRVGMSLPGARRSLFVRLHSGNAGIDPYTREVSDVYQDLFEEGSFIGKGIYEVEAFERAMLGRFPDNTVLSHDLLEACHARSGLVSDVEFFEEFPSRYNVDIARRYRWIRGDWQIARWLLPAVPGPGAPRVPNPLSLLSRWKIFDNLRRSLVPVAMVAFLLTAWLLLPSGGSFASLLILAIVAFPAMVAAMEGVLRKPENLPWALHLRSEAASAGRQAGQIFLTLAFLPYEAFVSLDAIGRTLVRIFITHKRRLEWQTSRDSSRAGSLGLTGFFVLMWSAPLIAVITASAMFVAHPQELLFASPFLIVWFLAPAIAWWISLPTRTQAPDLTPLQTTYLRSLARKTWFFFETFVNAQENWLPPDNFQHAPGPIIASRTSPTNMGLSLLANLAAWDFGYLTTGGLIQRTRDAFSTMQRMKMDRGHFFNWYDTRSLEPLIPRYISSVDSGNLAGHLLTLASGLRGLADVPVSFTNALEGLRDTLAVLRGLKPDHPPVLELAAALQQAPFTLGAARDLLERALRISSHVESSLAGDVDEVRAWSRVLKDACRMHFDEVCAFECCDDLMVSAPPGYPTAMPTLREIAAMNELSTSRDAGMAATRDRARLQLRELESLADQAEKIAEMDFAFLYDPLRDLFSTGYNVSERRSDSGYYDLLASEARLCSYVAIALGQVPQSHWFSLGRLLVDTQGEPILVSWSGSMFEYLMPLLVMPTYEHTLLDHSCRESVEQQIHYGKARGVPWGISESGYNRTDVNLNYQYRAFGVPGLGLKRGLAEDLVIAPYASVMGLMLSPREACENLLRLASEGREGTYGFYEAVDYTPSRLPPDDTSATVESYMAHHQGMSLLALLSVLRNRPMQHRFLSCPRLKAADLLLQERVPKTAATVFAEDLRMEESAGLSGAGDATMRVFKSPFSGTPEVHLLSNGRYQVVISSSGAGYSRWRDLAVTRWREDATRDCWGSFIYLRDLESGDVWSTGYQPTLRATQGYEAIFTQARAEFRQRHTNIDVHTEICVSPEDDIELRRVTLTNLDSVVRTIEITSYAEVVLALPAEDASHPAFSNLFVQTEFAKPSSAILCTRRPRSQEERPPWLFHLMAGHGGEQGAVTCETDRAKFVGRGGNLQRPAVMQGPGPLSNSVGSVLDPILSLRRAVTLAPGETAVVNMVYGVTETREASLAQVEQYQSSRKADRAIDLAWTHSQVALHHLNITEAEAQLFGRLSSALIYADPARRASPGVLRNNRRGQTGLWSYGISGDSPIVLIRISDRAKIEIVRQVIRAHSYWRMKGLTVELVILNEDASVYHQSLQDEITGLVSSGVEAQMLDQRGGIFVRRLEQIPYEDVTLLQAVARIVLDDEKGTLLQQASEQGIQDPVVPLLQPSTQRMESASSPVPARDLIFTNGYGGFTRDGHEYVITLEDGTMTPAPWVNVMASPYFGTVVSETGSAYTWVENAHEFRLTPWSNDPVQDTTGEAMYIRDEQTGEYWSPTPLPASGRKPYVIRHGFGYTVYEHTSHGIASELWVYVAMDAPVKFSVLKVRNISGRSRRLSVTGYWEWVLGDLRSKSLMHVQTEVDVKTGALLARNTYNNDFLGRIAFLDVNEASRTVTGDRKEFLGRNGGLSQPAAMRRIRLSGKVGAGLDPCGAIQVGFDLQDGQEKETNFRFGVGRDMNDVNTLIQRFRKADACRGVLGGVWEYWNRTLGTVNVDTPDPSVNVMANGWLLYQTLSCRVWGRSGFYQSGGAFGFRDQLQDVMALLHAEPGTARAHILLAAAHQFKEGDVQHWWHPPSGRGVRTRISDDFLWLPFVTCRYVGSVADTGILDEIIPFLEARAVKADEEAIFDLPNRSEESASLYDHCVRAIEHGFRFGTHGLPLIGTGDWNDGMNMVGSEGRGESVWLGFFLYDVLMQFAELAESRQDTTFAGRCRSEALMLQKNLEKHAWDGGWYRRAYFDNGEPLGSALSPECQIDSLPQSWSVLSGAGDPLRSQRAMQAVDERLVRRDAGLIQLFDPPFDKSELNPGYIKGYIPGVRENGGQYTHGAIWVAMAFAQMGQIERAWEIFAMLNPVRHGGSPGNIATYKVEPYVVSADIYGVVPHTGRGGWSWYTGSAGWMYRLLLETLLGIRRKGDQLLINPRMPEAWASYKIHYRYRQTVYHILISRELGGAMETGGLRLDGNLLKSAYLPLVDDRREHDVEYATV